MKQQMQYLQNVLKQVQDVMFPKDEEKSGVELLEDLADEMDSRDKKECWLCSELFNEDNLFDFAITNYGIKQVCQTCIDKDNEYKIMTNGYEEPTDYRNK